MQNKKMTLRDFLGSSFLLGVALLFGCAGYSWTPPPSWTLREDGHIRASQNHEDFTIEQFITKVKQDEGKEFVLVLTPAGEQAISRELARRDAKIIELQNQLSQCR